MATDSLRRITREPALILGVLVAAFGVLVAFGIDLSREQIGAVGVFAGAVMALLRFMLTPSSEVIAQQTPDGPVAGEAAAVTTGSPVAVAVQPVVREK